MESCGFLLMRGLFSGFKRDERGAVLVEFALILPILVALLAGVYEVSTYILLNNKLNRAAQSVAQLVARADDLTAADADGEVDSGPDLDDGGRLPFDAATAIMRPFDLETRGNTVISLVAFRDDAGPRKVVWQRVANEDNPTTGKMPDANGTVTGFDSILPNEGDFTVVVDVFYDYDPIFNLQYFTLFSGASVRLHERAVYLPRFADLPPADNEYNF